MLRRAAAARGLCIMITLRSEPNELYRSVQLYACVSRGKFLEDKKNTNKLIRPKFVVKNVALPIKNVIIWNE